MKSKFFSNGTTAVLHFAVVWLWCAALALAGGGAGGGGWPAGGGAGGGWPAGPSDRPEAYFNRSSYIRLSKPISLKQIVGLSFRTCVGGELFSQRHEGHSLHVTALFEHVVVSWARPGPPSGGEVSLPRATLDNRWHWVALRRRLAPPALLLQVDQDTQLVANATFNSELVNGGPLESASATLLVGNLFSGCIHEGPQLEFHAAATSQEKNVVFGHCPLTTDECKDRKDVLRMPPKDFCFNEPCLRHGTCISRHDRYECHCAARYAGNNCEVDRGDPCVPEPCQHGGRCAEDARGDYTCFCQPQYHGAHCELEVSLDPRCVAGPCRNNGSCSVPAGADAYACACPPGYAGRDCETDVDECAAAAGACLHGGRCVDAVNAYSCDCAGTGYRGARCELNVNECEEERALCGHGVCYDTYGGYVCACLPGYAGDHCQKVSACASSPCGAGGACVEEGATYRCACARGWSGALCTVPLQAPPAPSPSPAPPPTSCAHLLCPEHSHCRDSQTAGMPTVGTAMAASKQAQCYCDPGYFGASGLSPNCSTLEQACEVGVCLNGATCSLAPDHFNCTCAPGFKGAYCELAAGKALSELKTAERCAGGPCLHARACIDLAMGFRCECETGWTGPRCDTPAAAPAPAPLSAAGDGCAAQPCHNGGTCRASAEGFTCECRAGYVGALCDSTLDCRAVGCPPRQACVERAGSALWACEAAADSACASAPCHNGTCLALDNGDFDCSCAPGYTGRHCENEVDECVLMPKICNQGVCVNVPGSFQCYCKPGYTGDRCEQDIDECLSSPCKNGGSCQNLENNYDCTCMPGFSGKDCSTNIDECSPSPCAEGATCVDGVASYSCVCQQGLTGERCELNIDDCESEPCQHGGRCTDALNGFVCECSGTGYAGADCSLNIDECEPRPCRHGATCRDGLNDYDCLCHPGYTGKNCEVDVNECESAPCQFGGVCLERSNASLYRAGDDPAPPQVGPQPTQLLPAIFYEPFSYENASGFECVCVAGTEGARCETNVDECASAPCGHGKCVDAVGTYSCECAPGYEGDHCQLEIDECLRYKPCEHGRCYDRRASYYCECEDGWGGRNCSVVLEGCAGAPCRNNGTCLPWLYREHEHRFNCSCTPGYYGTACEKITTMSLERSSYAEVNTSREEGYDISFRFKTTLGSGLLAMGRGFTYFFLELSNGRLNLHSSLLNKWEGVFIGSNLNDSNWQKVFVTINSSHLVLAANEEQTIYPISQNEAYNTSVTSFPSTRLGTAGSSYATLTHGPNFFVGCFQDVVVNGQWVLPEHSNASEIENSTDVPADGGGGVVEESETEMEGGARALLRGVRAACPRRPQCAPNPCRSGGACEDYWTNYTCTCPRPYLGSTCQYNYTAATFGHEKAAPQSVVAVAVWEGARRAVRSALDISMFVRTRKPTGTIFYLGSKPRYGMTEETLVAASLKNGELLVHLQFNHTPEDYTVGGTRLDNGHLHLIQVVRNSTLVQVKLNGTEYFRKSISAAKQLDAQVLYLGGPPPVPAPPADTTTAGPQAPPAPPAPTASGAPVAAALGPQPAAAVTAPSRAPTDADYFKGVIQDVQISNGVNVTIVEFFPLREPGLALPPSFGEVSLDAAGVLAGERSDDACAPRPCLHNATCAVTWNDYTCECPRGYKGKRCAEVEFCQLQGCPLGSHCRNLDGGYECLSNATFDGTNTTLTYSLRVPRAGEGGRLGGAPYAEPAYTPPNSLTITYRSKTGGTLLHAELPVGNDTWWFSVGVFRDQATVQWRLRAADLPVARRVRKARADLDWSTLRFTLRSVGGAPAPAPALPPPLSSPLAPIDLDIIQGAFLDAEGQEEPGFSAPIDAAAWHRLMAEGVLRLGGVGPRPAPPAAPAPPADVATAPTADITYDEDWGADASLGELFKGCMGAVHVGGLLLPFFTEEELFVGTAAGTLRAQPHYALAGGRPWGAQAGLGCVLCLERECLHGGRCADVRRSYACACPAGFSGERCEVDVDECQQHECRNGATCQDRLAAYACLCPPGFDGVYCEHDVDECESAPCAHGGACTDRPGGFECACAAEWGGPRCERPRRLSCAHRPCAPAHAVCKDEIPDPPNGNNYTCACLDGWEGVHCELAFCEARPCAHGRCDVTLQVPACACEAGYSGAYCEAEVDECEEGGRAACLHAGLCIDQLDGFLCNCSGTGWTGARCELDVDECALGLVSCGPGECRNHHGGYTCLCSPGFCGNECALPDPCFAEPAGAAAGAEGAPANATGPCLHGGACEQRCSDRVDYVCHCVDGWGGANCTYQVVKEGSEGGGTDSSVVLISVGAALLGVACVAGALAVLAAQARRKRATRGTYSPSGQEYCNPRAEMMTHALKPPPEERLI